MPVHFDIEQWADFVRGLTDPRQEAQMNSHLAEGCARCTRQVSILRRLTGSTRAMQMAPAAPDDVVDRALTIFPPAPKSTRGSLRRLIAELVFDSFGAPPLEGVRSLRGGTRRLSYRTDKFGIDLLADFDQLRKSVMITGQLSSLGELTDVSRISVQLRSGRRLLQQTATNEAGKFQLDSPLVQRLILRVTHAPGREELEVPLHILTPSQSKKGN